MTPNNSDNEMSANENIEKQRQPMGRPKKPKRWNPDGSLRTEYYFKEHFHKPHTCEYCGKVRKCSDNIARHQKSAKCVQARTLLGLALHPLV